LFSLKFRLAPATQLLDDILHQSCTNASHAGSPTGFIGSLVALATCDEQISSTHGGGHAIMLIAASADQVFIIQAAALK